MQLCPCCVYCCSMILICSNTYTDTQTKTLGNLLILYIIPLQHYHRLIRLSRWLCSWYMYACKNNRIWYKWMCVHTSVYHCMKPLNVQVLGWCTVKVYLVSCPCRTIFAVSVRLPFLLCSASQLHGLRIMSGLCSRCTGSNKTSTTFDEKAAWHVGSIQSESCP